MANEIRFPGNSSYAYYFVILNASGQYYNYLTPAFEAYNSANWIYTKYCHSLSDVNSLGAFVADFPALSAGNYTVNIYRQSGGSPATSDKIKAGGAVYWDGTAEITPKRLSVSGSVNDSGATSLSFIGNSGLSSTDSRYVGMLIVFTSGNLEGENRTVSSYTGSIRTITVDSAFAVAPANGDTFELIGRNS